jgi:predicted DsbA family dithiol-disulfide isomerase
MRVEIWSDVVCPWCYIGKRRFEAALAQFPARDQVEVVWRAFELDPAAPSSYEGQGTYAERLARKYGTGVPQAQQMIDNMTAAAAEDGLLFDFTIARTGNTFDAHRLLHLAGARGVQDAVKERLLRATFTEGEPIADSETLVRLAAAAGLDADEARAVLASGRYADEVRADERQAQAYGITGVPFFVVDGRYGVSGAQPAELLLQALQQAWDERRPPLVMAPTGAPAPGCDEDSCAV